MPAARAAVAYDVAHPAPLFEVWPEHWKSVMLFGLALHRHCWRFGFAGPVALDFRLVRRVAKRAGIRLSRRREDDLIVMEGAALVQMERRRKNQRG